MKRGLFLAVLIVALGLAFASGPVKSQSGIIVQEADSVTRLSFTPNNTLEIVLTSLKNHPVWHSSETGHNYNLLAPAMPGSVLLDAPKITFGAAEASAFYHFGYPTDLISDRTPPRINNQQVEQSDVTAYFSFSTDEFAQARLRLGSAPDAYSIIYHDETYRKDHFFNLSDLSDFGDSQYYYEITVTDRSGNRTVEGEALTPSQLQLFLPLILKP
jgi:hypothetical protein